MSAYLNSFWCIIWRFFNRKLLQIWLYYSLGKKVWQIHTKQIKLQPILRHGKSKYKSYWISIWLHFGKKSNPHIFSHFKKNTKLQCLGLNTEPLLLCSDDWRPFAFYSVVKSEISNYNFWEISVKCVLVSVNILSRPLSFRCRWTADVLTLVWSDIFLWVFSLTNAQIRSDCAR